MKDMESEKFEESWKEAFHKAEVSPSEAVWTNIELELEKTKGSELKRRLMFYQLVAAASVVFALAIGGTGYYMNFKQQQGTVNNLALETRTVPDAQPAQADPSNTNTRPFNNPEADRRLSNTVTRPSDKQMKAATPQTERSEQYVAGATPQRATAGHDSASDGPEESITTASTHARDVHPESTTKEKMGGEHLTESSDENLAAIEASDKTDLLPPLPHQLDERSLPPLYEPREIALTLPSQQQQTVDPVVAMLARLEQRERKMRGEEEDKKEDQSEENLWTSVGFAAGSFNSIAAASSGSPAPAFSNTTMALAAPIVEKETEASGYSYSMGVNIGTRLSERWVFQGGVNYLTHSTEYTANNVVVSSAQYQQRFHPAATNDLIKAEPDLSNKIVYSAPYSVNNSMRYISIPVQAGYLLINKTFGLQLNAGVATDLFLQNTIKGNSPQMDKTSQSSGSDSPYRSVNLSGLFGTEVSYRFSENYRISINPGIRYPFNTIYKSELGVQSTPLTFDIGLRFRYIFH